ncbi:hypothetical protein KF913_21695 [Candidatus Obscuribacterales bacterium]|nr:hypothetical protein [Candidatus Obscuribacterales bacterium]
MAEIEKENQGNPDGKQKPPSSNAKKKKAKTKSDVVEKTSSPKPIEAVIVEPDYSESQATAQEEVAADRLEKPKIELPPHPTPAPEVTVAVEEGTIVEVVQREHNLSQTAPPYTMPRPHRGSPDSSPCEDEERAPEPAYEDEARKDVITSVQNMLKPHEGFLTRAQLVQASRELRRVTPYNFEAWRLHADVLLNALKQLETRQIQPDENFRILTIPLREAEVRDAAEAALRQCAHYAESEEKRIALIDEANSVRRKTWF